MSINPLIKLPDAVLTHALFPFCDHNDMANLSKVSKGLKKVSELDYVWKNQFEYYFGNQVSEKLSKKIFRAYFEGEHLKNDYEVSTHKIERDLLQFSKGCSRFWYDALEGPFLLKINENKIELKNILDEKTEFYEFKNIDKIFINHCIRNKNICVFINTHPNLSCLIYDRKKSILINQIDLHDMLNIDQAKIINDHLIAFFGESDCKKIKIKIYDFKNNRVFLEDLSKFYCYRYLNVNLSKNKLFAHFIYNSTFSLGGSDLTIIDLNTKEIKKKEISGRVNFYCLNNKIVKIHYPENLSYGRDSISFYPFTLNNNYSGQDDSDLIARLNINKQQFNPEKFFFQGNICCMYCPDNSKLIGYNLKSKKIIFEKKLNYIRFFKDIKIRGNKIYLFGNEDKHTVCHILTFDKSPTVKETNKIRLFNIKLQSIIQVIFQLARKIFEKIKELFQKIVVCISNLNKRIFNYLKK